MDLLGKAVGALADVEGTLQRLIEEGVRQKDYEGVRRLAELAAAISALAHEQEILGRVAARAQENGVAQDGIPPLSAVALASRSNGTGTAKGTSTIRRSGETYPQFERDGDKLVKIGWSERDHRAYEHRAPREAAIAVFEKLKSFATRGRVFGVNDIGEVYNSEGRAIPSYQMYLVLGWLRDAGLVDRKGKEGYVIQRSAVDANAFENLWTGLAERR